MLLKMALLHSFSWMSGIPLYMHSFAEEHLGCFQVLPIVNSAALNIGVHVTFQTMLYPGVGFLFFSQLPTKPELLH